MLHANLLKKLLILLLVAAAPAAAQAVALTGTDLLVPVVARTPGELGTQWRTDLVVTNTSRSLVMVPVEITFLRSGEPDQTLSLELGPLGSAVLDDVVLNHFGHERAIGMVRVVSLDTARALTARARVYNVGGGAGQYGQGVPALPTPALPVESFMPGLSGVAGNRTNVGVANPSDGDVLVTMSLYRSDGSFNGAVSFAAPARSVFQINDVFTTLNVAPFAGATVRVQSATGVYTYASVVRNDTGDAVFVTGAGQPAKTPVP